MANADFAVAVFPFLKTSDRVRIGGHIFRSTEDMEGLPPDQGKALPDSHAVRADKLRIKSAAYAILPALEVHSDDRRLRHLESLRDVVAYFYAAPHEVFGDVFLPPEETSLVYLRPRASASFSLVRSITPKASRRPPVEP